VLIYSFIYLADRETTDKDRAVKTGGFKANRDVTSSAIEILLEHSERKADRGDTISVPPGEVQRKDIQRRHLRESGRIQMIFSPRKGMAPSLER
jgi:hypothetical protein